MNLFRKIGMMIRAMLATAGRLVLMPVRLVDGTLGWVYRLVTAGPQVAPVEVEAPEFERSPEPQAEPEDPVIMGSWARRAVQSIVDSDFVLDKSLPPAVTDWALCLTPHERRRILSATDEAVGQHLLGVTPLIGLDGPLPVLDPKTQGPRAAEIVARRLERARDRQRTTMPVDDAVPRVTRRGNLRLVA